MLNTIRIPRERRRLAIINTLGGVCQSCWESDYDVLQAHHVLRYNHLKKFDLMNNTILDSPNKYPIENIEEELSICMCLCYKCHKKVHKGKLEEPKFRKRKVKIIGKWRELWS